GSWRAWRKRAPVVGALLPWGIDDLESIVSVYDFTAGSHEEEVLMGWKGETYKPGLVDDSSAQPWVETISWQPRAFIYHGFLSDVECEHLKGMVAQRLRRSEVVAANGSAEDPVRTSWSASIGSDEVVVGIEQRIARWTHLPASHGEPIEVREKAQAATAGPGAVLALCLAVRVQVLRYINNQASAAAGPQDYFFGDIPSPPGNRVATVLMYLTDVDPGSGGETSLPLAQAIDSSLQSTSGMSSCASRMGIAVLPRKGDALLFWDAQPDGQTVDRHSLHASCPTSRGEKWTGAPGQAKADAEVLLGGEASSSATCDLRNRSCSSRPIQSKALIPVFASSRCGAVQRRDGSTWRRTGTEQARVCEAAIDANPTTICKALKGFAVIAVRICSW
ncbi:hypothetical protein QJQ45_014892, partial [Haematococcus lacustris]